MRERLFDEAGDPIVTTIAVQNNLFYYAGLLMAQSFIQGGPKPNILSKMSFTVISAPPNKPILFKYTDLPDTFKYQRPIKKVKLRYKLTWEARLIFLSL